MDEKTTHNNEPGNTSEEHNEPNTAETPVNIPDNTITIDDVLSVEERVTSTGDNFTVVKRTSQTELIVPIRDPKKMPDHVKEDIGRTMLDIILKDMAREREEKK